MVFCAELFSHTAGEGGELQAMESLALGLCSRGTSPFLYSFLNLDLRFWNQIFTWKSNTCVNCNANNTKQKKSTFLKNYI